MPIKDCELDGKKGKQYGDSGKCYTGKDADEKAKAQSRAIHANQANQKKKDKS